MKTTITLLTLILSIAIIQTMPSVLASENYAIMHNEFPKTISLERNYTSGVFVVSLHDITWNSSEQSGTIAIQFVNQTSTGYGLELDFTRDNVLSIWAVVDGSASTKLTQTSCNSTNSTVQVTLYSDEISVICDGETVLDDFPFSYTIRAIYGAEQPSTAVTGGYVQIEIGSMFSFDLAPFLSLVVLVAMLGMAFRFIKKVT
jgi:hypothetical protein